MRISTENKLSEINTIENVNQSFFKKSHQLVFSQIGLSPVEHDIFALFLTSIHKDQWVDFVNDKTVRAPIYRFQAEVLTGWFNIDRKEIYATLYKPCLRLTKKTIGIKDDKKKHFNFLAMFKQISYADGVLTIAPNEFLMAEYLGVSKGHSQIPQKNFRKLKSEHAKRLYTMLCRFKGESTRLNAQTIKDLHGFFGLLDEKGNLKKKSYESVGILVSRIIKPSIEEINKTDENITFDVDEKAGSFGYAFKKNGRKVEAIEFLFRWKKNEISKPKETRHPSELTFDDAKVTLKEIKTRSRLPNFDELVNLQKHIKEMIFTGSEVTEENIITVKSLIAADKEIM